MGVFYYFQPAKGCGRSHNMKKPASDIHHLIKSLTAGEKKAFALYCSRYTRGEKNNYLKLYEAIQHQETYDEDKIKKQLDGKINIANFAVEKNNLYSIITQSLNIYHRDQSTNTNLQELIRTAGIFIHKNLHQQAFLQLVKAEKIATTHEKLHVLLEVYRLKKMVLRASVNKKKHIELVRIVKAEKDCIANMATLNAYESLSVQLFNFYLNSGASKKFKNSPDLLAIIKDPCFETYPAKGVPFKAHYSYFMCRLFYCLILDDYASSQKYSGSIVDLYESNPIHIKEEPKAYIGAIANLLSSRSYMTDFNEGNELLAKIKAVVFNEEFLLDDPFRGRILYTSYLSILNSYIMSGNFSRINSLLKDILMSMERFDKVVAHDMKYAMHYNIALSYFGNNLFKDALSWLNKIIHSDKLEINDEKNSRARILYVVVHYELKNFDLLDYEIDAVIRYLRNAKFLTSSVRIFLMMLKKLLDVKTNTEQYQILSSSLDTLREKEEPVSTRTHVLEEFNMGAWMESKMKNMQYAEVIRKKFEAINKNRKK